jgi:uncharacterized protein YlzI (FlbEa/FlbD family)
MIKIFHRPHDKLIGINPLHVMVVIKSPQDYGDTVTITLTNGEQYILAEDFDYVVESIAI